MDATKTKIKTPTYDEFMKIAEGKTHTYSQKEVLNQIKEKICLYEAKYKMTSEEFLPRYEAGDFEMDDNYLDYELLDWSGNYKRFKQNNLGLD